MAGNMKTARPESRYKGFTQLLFFRAAEGLGETMYFPASMLMVSDYHGRRTRSRAVGIHQASVYMGTNTADFLRTRSTVLLSWMPKFLYDTADRKPPEGSRDLRISVPLLKTY